MELSKKRYILFGFLGYYPRGGMNDALFSFDTIDELIKEPVITECDGYNILDTETFNVGRGFTPTMAYKNLKDKESFN